MIFGFLLSSLLLMAPHHQLPSGWHTEGHSFKLNEQWGPHPQEPSVLDTTGRYLYTSDGPCHQWDFRSGRIRPFAIIATLPRAVPVTSNWKIDLRIRWGTLNKGSMQFNYANGNLLAGDFSNLSLGGIIGRSAFVARIGGHSFQANEHTGKLPVVHAGFDLLLGSGSSLVYKGRPVKRDPVSTGSDEILVAHNHEIVRATLPGELANCHTLPGGISWATRNAFIDSVAGPNAFGYFINFGKRKPSIRAVPLSPISATPICVLANGSICGQEIDTGKKEVFSVAIYSIHSRKWQVFPGLMIYGRSANGRAIVYGWHGDDHIHLARISGSW